MSAYYNEFKSEAAHMLRGLIKAGLIADGEVDERSITDVKAEELKGFTQCHFFAGIGGWSVALRLAGWPDDRPVWTGSCPCQPFSTAGKGKAQADERHLWPVWNKLIEQSSPAKIYGEQVASAIPHGWLDGVYADLEGQGYAIGSAVLPACAVDAPHKRDRTWFVADGESERWGEKREHNQRSEERSAGCGDVANTSGGRCGEPREGEIEQPRGAEVIGTGCVVGNIIMPRREGYRGSKQEPVSQGREGEERYPPETGFWGDCDWIICGDGKARRIPPAQSGICIVAYGVQYRAPLLHGFGNAIVPEVAARFIKASM